MIGWLQMVWGPLTCLWGERASWFCRQTKLKWFNLLVFKLKRKSLDQMLCKPLAVLTFCESVMDQKWVSRRRCQFPRLSVWGSGSSGSSTPTTAPLPSLAANLRMGPGILWSPGNWNIGILREGHRSIENKEGLSWLIDSDFWCHCDFSSQLKGEIKMNQLRTVTLKLSHWNYSMGYY